jgi:TolB-like protein/class 3 adenylate cyclase
VTADPERRLAAILSADVAGYSRLMAEDEDATVRTLRAWREQVAALIVEHRGRLADFTGDNFLAEFPAARDAVECALEIQRVVAARNAALPEARRMRFRIGAHLGDVRHEDGRLFGDGVNVAARLQPLAEPGGLCLSLPLVEMVRGKIALELEDIGEQVLKNIPNPVHAFRVGPEGAAKAAPAPSRVRWLAVGAMVALVSLGGALWLRQPGAPASAPTAPAAAATPARPAAALVPPGFDERPAIAVLPFDNLSTDPEQAFFADGLAEDLTTRLSSWRAFPVISRTSSFQYRGDKIDLKRVGTELGARYLVEGSVRRAGGRIRIAAQLIDATSDQHLWAETYDRDIADVFAVQDEISATIAASLVGDLNRAEAERARQRGTDNLEAWSLYMLGVQSKNELGFAAVADQRSLLERAVALDPRFATAQAELAYLYMAETMIGGGQAREKLIAAALDRARLAAELDSREPLAQIVLTWVHFSQGDLPKGLASARQAVELNPSMPEAWIWFGWGQLLAGDPEACIAATERAQKLRPHWQGVENPNDNLASAYFEAGRYREGLEAGRRLVEAQPEFYAYVRVAQNAAALGRIDEARAAVAEARRLLPSVSLEVIQQIYGVSRPEIDARRNALLRRAGLE